MRMNMYLCVYVSFVCMLNYVIFGCFIPRTSVSLGVLAGGVSRELFACMCVSDVLFFQYLLILFCIYVFWNSGISGIPGTPVSF